MEHNLLLQRRNFTLILTLIIFFTAKSLVGMEEDSGQPQNIRYMVRLKVKKNGLSIAYPKIKVKFYAPAGNQQYWIDCAKQQLDDLMEKLSKCDKESRIIQDDVNILFTNEWIKSPSTMRSLSIYNGFTWWKYTYYPDLDQIIKEKYKRNCALQPDMETFYVGCWQPWKPKNLKQHRPTRKEKGEMLVLTKQLNPSKRLKRNR